MGFVDSEQRLHELATAEAGSDDFGDPVYLKGFRVLLEAYDNESKLNDFGRQNTMEKLQQLLAQRLRAEQFLSRWPILMKT